MRLLTLDPEPKSYETYLHNTYGLEALTLEQEMKLTPNVKRTRSNKIEIIDTCAGIRKLLDTIEYRARMAPAEEDQEHADLVEEFYNAVYEVYNATEKAWRIGQ